MRYYVTEQMDDGTLAVVAETLEDPEGPPERQPGESPYMHPDNIALELVGMARAYGS